MKRIYFDYAATTPTDPEVIKAMEPYYFEKFGNPSSPHSFGREAQKALEDSRQAVAGFIGARSEEIVFNSGSTEGLNQVILGMAHALKEKGNHMIVSPLEHKSVLEPVYFLQKMGLRITYLRVDKEGNVDPEEVRRSLTSETILIAVMHANNEIGTLQPIALIGEIARSKGIPFLVDAAQTIGHIPLDVQELKADFLAFSAHKFYGPKGVGALFVRKGMKVPPFILGGDQERGLRSSTSNVSAIVGLAKALLLCRGRLSEEMRDQFKLRDKLLTAIPKLIDGVKINGPLTNRLPQNAHFAFEKVAGESLLMSLDMIGVAASMGSACSSGAMEVSHVLRSIGLSDELALGALRLTLGRWTKEEDVDFLLAELPLIVKSLRI